MTNPLCECPVAGYCNRHKMDKNETFHALCHGDRGQAGWKYFVAWESGKMGAVSPHDANLNPPPFEGVPGEPILGCSGCGGSVARPSIIQRVASAAQAAIAFVGDGMKTASENEQADRRTICGECPLNRNGTCDGCGCIIDLKVQARLEECPAKKWHAELHPVRPLVDPVRNLIMHVLPVAANDNWKWNLDQIAARQNLFNGKRILAIAVEESLNTGGKALRTVSPDEVINYSTSIGLEWTVIESFKNNNKLREVATFPWLLGQVQSTNANEVTFACHAKGATREGNAITTQWSEMMYRVCLDDWFTVHRTLERFSMAGAFRRYQQFRMGNDWDYSGTFYWFRNDDLFRKQWKQIDKFFAGTETYPAKHFTLAETACLFSDETGDLYHQDVWDKLQREIDIWEVARR